MVDRESALKPEFLFWGRHHGSFLAVLVAFLICFPTPACLSVGTPLRWMTCERSILKSQLGPRACRARTGSRLTRHVENRIGVFRVLLQHLDSFERRQNHQLNLALFRLAFHLLHNR